MAEILGAAPEALSNEEIIRTYNQAITQAIRATWDPQFDFERTTLLMHARTNWQMYRGFQNLNLGWDQDEYSGQQADLIPFDYGSAQEETGADIRLTPVINFLNGDGAKFMAVMGSSSPRVKAVADDMRSQEDIASAHCADVNIRDLWIKNKIDRQWKIPAFHIYTTGPCFIRGYWNTDAIKYGQSIEPKIEIQEGPGGMPMPVVIGDQPYDNGDAELSFHSVLEVTIPWRAKELRNNFLCCERMMSKWALLDKYKGKDGNPGPLDQYRDGEVPDDLMNGSSVTAAEARQATTNPSGTATTKKPYEWRLNEWWLPPHLFQAIQASDARKVLGNQFSRGLYVARVGSVTVEIDEREVTEEWTVATVNREETIISRPVCADAIPLQRMINDLVGMAIETILRAITQTIVDNMLIDRQAMSTKEAVPAEMILTALPVDGDLRERIFQIPPARLSDQVLPMLNAVRAWSQDITGIRPELSGGGQPTQTFAEARQRKNQALQQLAPQAQSMRDAAADIARIMVVLRSKFGSGTVKAQRRGAYGMETDVADMADLQTSGWHTEADDSFPLTLSDKRDAVYSLLKDGMQPEVLQVTGVLDILNASELVELLGVPGFASAIVEQKEKTLQDIFHLLQGRPIMGQNGPQCSMPLDMFDDHQIVDQLVSRWLRSPAGQKFKGTPGFLNVVLFWQQHHALVTPPAPLPEHPLKGSVAISLKAEDTPQLIPSLLEAAGVPAGSLPKSPVSMKPPAPPNPGPGIVAPLSGGGPQGGAPGPAQPQAPPPMLNGHGAVAPQEALPVH